MFDSFTDSAKKSLHLGRQEAKRFQLDVYLTEHLLLGLVAEGAGLAARYLAARGIHLDDLRAEVDEEVERGAASHSAQLPFAPRTKKVLEFSMEEAGILGHMSLGTVHLLLGLLHEGESLGARILAQRGIDIASVRAFAAASRGGESAEIVLPPEGSVPPSFPWPLTPAAERVLELGLREAAALGQGRIGPEHLLLGLLADPESPSAAFLGELDLTLESYRAFLHDE